MLNNSQKCIYDSEIIDRIDELEGCKALDATQSNELSALKKITQQIRWNAGWGYGIQLVRCEKYLSLGIEAMGMGHTGCLVNFDGIIYCACGGNNASQKQKTGG